MKKTHYIILVLCILFGGEIDAEDLNQPTPIYGNFCQEKLYSQHRGSYFKLAVFCDDAQGTNVGVIFHPEGNKDWYWQDLKWSQNVTAFWWSPGYKFLYVSTSGIYGSGAVYELDLVNREYKDVLPDGYPPTAGTYSSTFIKYNSESNTLECRVEYFHREKKEPISEIIEIPIK